MKGYPVQLLSTRRRRFAKSTSKSTSRSMLASTAGTALLALLIAAGCPARAPAQQGQAPTPAPAASAAPQPLKLDPKAVLVLVRSALTALDQANKTGNYSVLHDLGSPDFQRDNTVAKLGEIFAGQRNAGLDLGGALILEPTITLQPRIETSGLLHLEGYFPVNTDGRLNFELLYQFVGKKLMLYGLSVNVAQVGTPPAPAPVVQTPAPPPAATPIKPGQAKARAKTKPQPKPAPAEASPAR